MRKILNKVNRKQATVKSKQKIMKEQDVPYAIQLNSVNNLDVGVSKSNRGKQKGCLRKEWVNWKEFLHLSKNYKSIVIRFLIYFYSNSYSKHKKY